MTENFPGMEESNSQNDIKLIEARTAILLQNGPKYVSRSESTMWILEHMYCPLVARDYEQYELLLLSGNVKPSWERKKKDIKQMQTDTSHFSSQSHTMLSPSVSEFSQSPSIVSSTSQNSQPTTDKVYVITPRTRILTISKEHSIVFMIDLSSSLATIEASTGKVMIGNAVGILENIIQGLIRPFSLNVSESGSPINLEYVIRITVIAECSQFGSNMNVIPILAEYPTMRVLLQNIHVTPSNINTVMKTLNELIDIFKSDLAKFRKNLKEKRKELGYELDVRDDHSQSVTETAESNFNLKLTPSESTSKSSQARKSSNSALKVNGSVKKSQKPPQTHRHAKSRSISKQQTKKADINVKPTNGKKNPTSTSTTHHHHRRSSSANEGSDLATDMNGPAKLLTYKDKKDVWGVGKTGSSLSYILRAGLFALNLLPNNGQPSIILLTDGVVKSNIQEEAVVSQLTSDGISCSVVQIGQDKSFFPGFNFGFVPDNEILEFLTSATYGNFSYADQCPPLIIDENPVSPDYLIPPNIYHHRYLLKEIYLDHIHVSRLLRKSKENNPSNPNSQIENDSVADVNSNNQVSSSNAHFERRLFPWDPRSIPIAEDLVRLKYKEYFLPAEFWHFLKARIRQGFIVQSVSFFDELRNSGNKSANNGFNKQSSIDGIPNFQSKQNILIILILRWQPNVTVQYSIKALWTSSLKQYLNNLNIAKDKLINIPEGDPVIENDNLFTYMRVPKVEITIKSNSSFSHLLHNWDSLQRRSQMMAVQGGNAAFDLAGTPGFIKVGKMKRFLERLSETDTMLKQLVQFTIFEKNQNSFFPSQQQTSLDPSFNIDLSTQLSYIQKFSSHWAKLERSDLRVFNKCWYDEVYFNIIIGESLNISVAQNHPEYQDEAVYKHKKIQMIDNNDFDDLQVSLNQIYLKLEKWSTFISEDQHIYIKILNINEISSAFKTHITESYTSKNYSSNSASTPTTQNTKKAHVAPRFCELRLIKETDRAMCIKMMFFNVSLKCRESAVEEVKNLLVLNHSNNQVHTLVSLEIGKSSSIDSRLITEEDYYLDSKSNIIATKRPFSSLLMRDGLHYLSPVIEENDNSLKLITSNNSNAKYAWYINTALLLTGEFIVRNYLNQYNWCWDTQEPQSDSLPFRRYFTPITDLAFDHIVIIRLEQHWNLISSNKYFAHFYKEISCIKDNSEYVYSAQYFIWKDNQKKRITTELWLEPTTDETTLKMLDAVKSEVFEADKYVLSQLITFDIVYMFGQTPSVSMAEALSDTVNKTDAISSTAKWMERSTVFNLSSILKLGSFLYALYPCPNYDRHFHPEGNDTAILDQHQHQQIQQQTQTAPAINETPEAAGINARRRVGLNNNTVGNSNTRTRTVTKFSPIGSPLHTRTPMMWHSDKCTTCTCPRPDELFCHQKDEISKLKPVLRDIALLHYYVEQSLSSVTDRSLSLAKMSNDDFWSSTIKELMRSPEIGILKSTLYVAHNIRDLRCFIKIFDPAVFIIILIPRLDSVVKGLWKIDNSIMKFNDETSYNHMGLMMFECQRQDTTSSYGNSLKVNTLKIQPIDSFSSKEWLESLRSTLRPKLSRGYFMNTQINVPLSDRTLRLMQDVAQVYSRSFVKSIFTCLLHGRAVDSEDFEKVLEICDESNLDIDLTGYLNVQTLLKKRSRTSEEELFSANQRFISVLGHYFEPVIISNSKWSNMYCYRPPFAKAGQKLGLSLASGEKPSNLADVVVCAQNPLFVRLDCTLRKPSKDGNGFTEVTFPLKNLPVSYEGELNDGTLYNYEPQSIGTEKSPVASADGTKATLHLVCMTLPQSEYDPPNALFSHKPSCPADSSVHHQASFLDGGKTHRARLPSLSQDKQDALVETEARLTWLFTEEIMHGLLRSGPITQNVILYIEAQLKKKNPFVDFPTTMFIPLAFVKNQTDSRRMFFEELEKHNNTPYRLVRVGDCFYASDNGSVATTTNEEEEVDERRSDFDGEGLNITTKSDVNDEDEDRENFRGNPDNDNEESNDEFCQGLGISIQPETPEDDDTSTIHEPVRPQLYWLLLIPQAQSVQIYFYSKMQQSVNRSEIIRVTKAMVNEVLERTNKMSLLNYLNDEKKCSKYLLASIEEDKGPYSSSEETSEEEEHISKGANNNLVEILSTSGEENTFSPPKKFYPGQFSCGLVATKRFPLHWRIPANTAYSQLISDALTPFLVKNKPGMFVCSQKKSVVYCFLSEINPVVQNPAPTENSNQTLSGVNNNINDDINFSMNPDSPFGTSYVNTNDVDNMSISHRIRHPAHIHNKTSPQSSITSDRQPFSPRQSPSINEFGAINSSPTNGRKNGPRYHEGRELVLDVYGVSRDEYLIDGLYKLIESRITSEITLKEVQQFLYRNPNSKLSSADISFILPMDKKPLIQKQLAIPSLVKNTVQFLKILRRNIVLGSSMNGIHSSYLAPIVKRYHGYRYPGYDSSGHVLDENESKMAAEEFSTLDLSFYYNYANRAPGTYLPFEQKVGEGIAGICLSILDKDDSAYTRVISPIHYNEYEKISINTLKTCLNSDFEHPNNESNLRIAVDIWSHCKLQVEELYYYIYKVFRQSICDYMIETVIKSIPNSKKSENSFKSTSKLLIFALQKAVEWESSSVKQISQPVRLAPWYFDDIILQLKLDLLNISPLLESVIARTTLSSDLFDTSADDNMCQDYRLYIPGYSDSDSEDELYEDSSDLLKRIPTSSTLRKRSLSRKSQKSLLVKSTERRSTENAAFNNKNLRYLLISGLPELQNRYGLAMRRLSSEVNSAIHNGRAKYGINSGIIPISEDDLHPHYPKNDSVKRDDTISLHSRQESIASSISKAINGFMTKQKNNDLKDVPPQHSFVVFTFDSSQFTLFAYNCSDAVVDQVHSAAHKNITQQETRNRGLINILHQKLGLFHHSDSMVNILTNTVDQDVHVGPQSIFNPTVPLQHPALTQVQINANNNKLTMSPNLANTIGRLAQIDSSVFIPSPDTLGGDRKTAAKNNKVDADFENIRQLVINNFEFKNRRNDRNYVEGSVLEKDVNAKLCKPANSDGVFTAVREADANTVLRDVYAHSTEDNKNHYKDYLLRHGEPYLEMYLARSKPLAAHEKAFKVMKWTDPYLMPKSNSTVNERMKVDELKEILKASRLLHFCRTPLIFSWSNSMDISGLSINALESKVDKFFNNSIVSKSEQMTAWYERLSRGFMKEYTSYLESVGMHLIVYGPSSDDPEEMDAYLSKFTITQDYSVDSPIVYLLQAFKGGSIMCEVRLTGSFVSVTLYTLHRRYGRLHNSPFSIRQRNQNDGRKNFQDFMGECDRFKLRIHVNSFVYDFHLRHIQRSLDDFHSIPQSLNLLNIIKNTVTVYERPAIYSRNRIISGIYEFSVEESLGNLPKWIMNNGDSLKLQTLFVDKSPVACFISSDYASFESDGQDSINPFSVFRYTLIICPTDKSNSYSWKDSLGVHRQGSFDMTASSSTQKIVNRVITSGPESEYSRITSVQYYILVTYRGMDRCVSSDTCQKAWSNVLRDRPRRYANFLDEPLYPEKHTMKDVFEAAKAKINHIIEKAVHFYNREAEWNKLYEIVRPNLSKESPEDLVKFTSGFNPIDLRDADPSFKNFLELKGINWNNALDNIKKFYMLTCGEIQIRDTRHVLLFIPNAERPAFFHFTIFLNGSCTVTINTKNERKVPHVLSREEELYIVNLATNITYYIWKQLQYSN